MAETPELSIVIPCRNEAANLSRQLDALAGERPNRTYEVIVSDNGSTDATAALALSYRDSIPNLRVVDASARSGRHHACNVGVAHAAGRSIIFLDADDEIAPGYLAAMAAALQKHDVVAARLDHETLDPTWMRGVGSALQTTGLQDGFGFLPFGAGCSLGFRHSVFDAIGGFREEATFCEDVDISWRAQLAGYDIAFVPDAVVRYQSRPSLRRMFRQHRQYARAQAVLYRDYRNHGMPRRTTRDVAHDWWAIVRAAPLLRSRDARARWCRRTARAIGRLEGSMRFRVWYP